MKVRITFTEPILGTKTGDLEIYKNFLLDKTMTQIPPDEQAAVIRHQSERGGEIPIHRMNKIHALREKQDDAWRNAEQLEIAGRQDAADRMRAVAEDAEEQVSSTIQEAIEKGEMEIEKKTTFFHRNADGAPILWDYVIKGFFKDAQGVFNRVKSKECPELKAYKKVIDGLIFIFPREIVIDTKGQEVYFTERPLRAQTAQGERVALARSETIPAGAEIEIEIQCLDLKLERNVGLWLDYGKLRGLGQWRNASWGRFVWEEV